ncbi:MAG: ABC transporter substrate-binding protein [Coriobacteriia bacterium]|nr:ABC transporter substrate-binding protein [Coriobacteriia bacterium]
MANNKGGGIVALGPSDCEILCDLGAGDKIVARGSMCDYPESVKSIPDVGSGDTLNTEAILKLKPDTIVMPQSGYTINQVNALPNPYVYNVYTMNDMYNYILKLGEISDRKSEAENMVSGMKAKLDQTPISQKKVCLLVAPCDQGIWVAGKYTFQDEVMRANNVFSDVEGWVQVSPEQLESRHPDLIIECYNDPRMMRPGPRLVEAFEEYR